MLRFIHTADWHLGHTLHGVSRHFEHQRFLDWLLGTLEECQADALIVAGDIFDSANPPVEAQAMLYRFLTDARARLPNLDMLLVAGNHDSPARLEAPLPLLHRLGIRVVGTLPRDADGRLDPERLLVPLRGSDGDVAAWCAAVPYLRPSDLPLPDDPEADPLIYGVEQLYVQALELARERRQPGQALMATGHCYMVGAQLSEVSERRILGGNQHALPASLFPDDLDYAALGHLHLAQRVGGAESRRYSGSPIPLALNERRYTHQVLLGEWSDGAAVSVESLSVPRQVDILRLPKTGAAPLDVVADMLDSLELDPALSPEAHPFLEVCIRLDQPEPGLRQRVEEQVAGKPLRLVKISLEYAGGAAQTHRLPDARLEELAPERVFRQRYRQQFEGEPDGPLLEAFAQLLQDVQEAET